jgi:hypothetical protein
MPGQGSTSMFALEGLTGAFEKNVHHTTAVGFAADVLGYSASTLWPAA